MSKTIRPVRSPMQHGTSEIDASFYGLIHRLAGSQLQDEPAERRRTARHPFSVVQWIAPRRGSHFPDDHEFLEVRCHDLSRAGFSFFLPIRPDFRALVAAFGTPGQLVYVGAEVLRCHSVLVYPSGELERIDPGDGGASQGPRSQTARPMVLVACQFTKRLTKPPERAP
jgi:hypothetical protein